MCILPDCQNSYLYAKRSTQETFTGIPKISERFTTSTAFQYHQLLPKSADLVTYIQQKVCARSGEACFAKIESLNSADYLDVDFDTISQTLTLSAFRHEAPSPGLWNERISNDGTMARIEVGILANEKPTEPEELSLGGFLTIIGEDDKPSICSKLIPLSSSDSNDIQILLFSHFLPVIILLHNLS